jgi:5-formyltetrahydrofolate cyclo-ligase
MNLSIAEQKTVLRREMRLRLKQLAPAERATASAQASERLRGQPVWKQARGILLYVARPDELDLWPLLVEVLAEGRLVALPRFVPATQDYSVAAVREPVRDLVAGAFGIPEPAPHCPAVPRNQLDLALVPGIVFDQDGRRLGRGKGFYDRLLPSVSGTLCGVALDWQVLPSIPAEPHDQTLNCILTPTRWLACKGRARFENEVAG